MSLRSFHLLFIALSVVLAAFVAAWAAGEYRAGQGLAYAATGVGAAAVGVVLAVYGARFRRRTRTLA
jgi:hypothetical protein